MKLMIRLPALRGELQVIHGHDDTLRELAAAYEDATQMLATLRTNSAADRGLVREYEAICSGLEEEIVGRCIDWRSDGR